MKQTGGGGLGGGGGGGFPPSARRRKVIVGVAFAFLVGLLFAYVFSDAQATSRSSAASSLRLFNAANTNVDGGIARRTSERGGERGRGGDLKKRLEKVFKQTSKMDDKETSDLFRDLMAQPKTREALDEALETYDAKKRKNENHHENQSEQEQEEQEKSPEDEIIEELEEVALQEEEKKDVEKNIEKEKKKKNDVNAAGAGAHARSAHDG